MKKMSTEQLLNLVVELDTYDYVGVAGYSSTPYFEGRTRRERVYLPCKGEVGFADRRLPETYEGDPALIRQMIETAPRGAQLVIPNYSGCNHDGEWVYTHAPRRRDKGWRCRYIAA